MRYIKIERLQTRLKFRKSKATVSILAKEEDLNEQTLEEMFEDHEI